MSVTPIWWPRFHHGRFGRAIAKSKAISKTAQEFTIWVLGACVLVCCDAFNMHLCTAPAGTMAHMTAPHPIVGLRTWTAHCQLADRLPLAGVLADGLLQVLTQQPSVLETDPVQLLALATALETCRPDWCQRWMRSDLQMERKIKNRLGGRRSHQKAQPWVDIQKTNVGDHTKTPACRWHRAQALSANAAMPRVIGWQLQCERQVSCLFVFVPPPNLTSLLSLYRHTVRSCDFVLHHSPTSPLSLHWHTACSCYLVPWSVPQEPPVVGQQQSDLDERSGATMGVCRPCVSL